MQRSKWYALVFLLGAFIAGAAIGYAADALDRRQSVPDAFRELAERELGRED